MGIYQLALKAMFRLDPEKIHGYVNNALAVTQMVPPVRFALSKVLPVRDDVLSQDVFGVTFPRPLGLAAGFDKNAAAPDVWAALGFGHAELGTVTASPQPGNPKPRLYRLTADRGLLNRMGFNNEGAAVAARNLRMRNRANVVGINIGKTKLADDAVADYRTSAMLLGDLADYLVVNVSSPNTPGLRDLQAVESLRPILEVVQQSTATPVLVKIAPDLADEEIDAIADLAVELSLAGIVATNTTISRDGLRTKNVDKLGAGGVSGAPVAERSLEVLRRLYARVGGKVALVSVGGIETPQQAWERIGAGADLLEGYTPMIYGGPAWIRSIHKELARQVRAHDLSNLSEAVGRELPWAD
ncbi:quinone-dependent dihydroorotate dehydrogenase [Corynebacterium uterequi]|uniref:Dihydroorotate dehydrogenase (quinone) n=1 Tax=Corynebacterium uterequi TaxID=1072256 RepID=A0A0G3HIX0_9CORY|nr:quinone-dependent dihydroorotate dehydrogenase [Corynebacterium uterequi]AKK11102.1 dihydroorotate oxidase A [Corynebacterium uterequi]